MKRIAKILLLSSLIAAALPCAGIASAATPVHLGEFFKMILINNRSVHALLHSLEADYYAVLASVGYQRPVASISAASGWTSRYTSVMGAEDNMYTGSAGLSIGHAIDLTGRYSLDERQNIVGYEVTRSNIDAQLNSLFANAESVWWSTVLARENVRLHKEILRQRSENHRVTMEKYRQELVPKLDVVRSEARVVEAETLLIASETVYSNLLTELAYLVGGADVEPYDVELAVPGFDIPEDYEDVLNHKAELRAAALAVERAKLVKKLMAKGMSPTLTLGLSWMAWSEPATAGTPQDQQVGASANLSIPLLDGNTTKYKTLNADRMLKSAEANFDAIKQQSKRDLDIALNTWRNASAAEENKKRQVERAEEELRITGLMYAEGIGAQIDLINAQTDYQTVKTEYLDAVLSMYRALVDMRKAIGSYSTTDAGTWQESVELYGKGNDVNIPETASRKNIRDSRWSTVQEAGNDDKN